VREKPLKTQNKRPLCRRKKIYFDNNYDFSGVIRFQTFENADGENVTVPVLMFDPPITIFDTEDKNVKFELKEIQVTSAEFKIDKSFDGKRITATGLIGEPGAGKNHIGPFTMLIRSLNRVN
jgi:hypothetical protein